MKRNSQSVQEIEELLSIYSRSIVAPDQITAELGRLASVMRDASLEKRFIVEGCEKLSLLAVGLIRSGYASFADDYAGITGIDHWTVSVK